MQIGELAQRLGLRASAIRYYESLGVLDPAKRKSGRRQYGPHDVNRLKLLQAVQQAGFTLAEARTLLPVLLDNRGSSKRWREIAQSKLQELDASIQRLQSARSALAEAMDCTCAGSAEDCKLVAKTSQGSGKRIKRPVRL